MGMIKSTYVTRIMSPATLRHMKLTKNIKYGLVFVLIVLCLVAAWRLTHNKNQPKIEEAVVVTIADLPIVQALPLYVAEAKGYFEDEGVEMKRFTFNNPNQIVDGLLSGDIDFAIDAATGIVGIAESKKPGSLKIFMLAGGDNVVENDAILVRADNNTLTEMKDLSGKSLGILPGIQWRTIAETILLESGLDTQSATLIELAPGLQAQALESGAIDALLGVEPIPTIVRQKEVGKDLLPYATIRTVADPFYGGAGVISTSFLREHPGLAEKVISAIGKAARDIQDNPNEARQHLSGNTPLTSELIDAVPLSLFRMYNDFNKADLVALKDFYRIFYEQGVVDSPIDAQGLLYGKTP